MTSREERKFKKFADKLNVLLIASSDWCALGESCARSLRSVGVNATALAANKQKSNYLNQGIVYRNRNQIRPYAEKANVIIFMHSYYIETGVDLRNKKVLVWHTGSRFRQHSKDVNRIFNPIVSASICGRDVFGYGAKNEKNILAPVDTDMIKPNYERVDKNKIIIAHYPTGDKGIDVIQSCIKQINKSDLKNKFRFDYDAKRVVWKDHMERVSKCDIYIEEMREKQKNQLLSLYGISTPEAAALGKIVITKFLFLEEYERKFGKCELQVAKTPDELIQQIKRIISLSDDDLLKLKRQSREWAIRYHSYKAVGVSMVKLFKEIWYV